MGYVQAAVNVEVWCIMLSVPGQTTTENEKLFAFTSTAITASYTLQSPSIAYIAKYSILSTVQLIPVHHFSQVTVHLVFTK